MRRFRTTAAKKAKKSVDPRVTDLSLRKWTKFNGEENKNDETQGRWWMKVLAN